MGQNIFYVGHNFYVGCVGHIYFGMGQTFLRGSKFFTWVQSFCVGQLLFTRRDYFTILLLIA